MRELVGTDELKNAHISDSDLSGAQIRGVNFSNVKVTDSWLFNTDISGLIGGLKINGVDVEPLIEAELDRRHPERTKLRPTDVEGLRTAFDVVEDMWARTTAMVSAPDPTGHPQGTHRVLNCFGVVLHEEFWHHQYATRDLGVLERG